MGEGDGCEGRVESIIRTKICEIVNSVGHEGKFYICQENVRERSSWKCQKSLAVATIYLSSPGISLWSCHHHFFSNSDCFILFGFFVFYCFFRFSCWAVQKCFTRGWCGRSFKMVEWTFIFTMSFSPGNQSYNHSYFRFFPWELQHLRKKAFTGTKFWIVSSKCNWNWSQSSCSVLRCCKNWHFILSPNLHGHAFQRLFSTWFVVSSVKPLSTFYVIILKECIWINRPLCFEICPKWPTQLNMWVTESWMSM